MHIAETREQAFKNARWGFERYLGYLNNNQPRFIVPKGEDPLEWFVENRYGVCGTPDDAIALIERLQDKQGEFGVFLQQAHNWADFEATKRSYELYARYVMPHFSQANRPREASFQWCGDNRAEFSATGAMSGTTRSFTRFSQAIDEIIDARVYSGIHFRTADEDGATIGEDVARHGLKRHFERD